MQQYQRFLATSKSKKPTLLGEKNIQIKGQKNDISLEAFSPGEKGEAQAGCGLDENSNLPKPSHTHQEML